MCLQIMYILIYMYKVDLVLNNVQWLICHKNKPNLNDFHTDLFDPQRNPNRYYHSESEWTGE